ncbi:hypothetical protein F5Y14DRAFT_402761 [Nemania sp. NC0429]|nr:hypothetical protein F5Y14DRAFT_402761 [Nemania sp. NC0429]
MPRKYRQAGNTCRQRKLKCDETFPICRRCSKAQRYCDRAGRPASTAEHPSRRDLDIEKSLLEDEDPRKALGSPELANFFRRYISNIAPWYDLSDSQCCFSTKVPIIALDEPLLFYAIIALSAVYVSQTTTPSARTIAEAYHTCCIRRLIELKPEDVLIKQGVALAATCLLRSYEILAENHDPNRHLKGAFSLALQCQNFLDRSAGGLLHSGFWNYLREDITFSLFRNCALKIKLDSIAALGNVSSDEDHLNSISLILGRIINAMIGSTSEMAGDTWEAMRSCLKAWLSALPAHFEPFSRAALPSLFRLPTVHMLKPSQAASRHYFLVSCAVLAIHAQNPLEVNGLMSFASSMGILIGTVTTKEDLLERIGLEICGIAFTSNEPSVLVNAFGPISYCAKYIRIEASRQEVVRHLMASRKATGWPVQQVVSDLERHWATNPPAS